MIPLIPQGHALLVGPTESNLLWFVICVIERSVTGRYISAPYITTSRVAESKKLSIIEHAATCMPCLPIQKGTYSNIRLIMTFEVDIYPQCYHALKYEHLKYR